MSDKTFRVSPDDLLLFGVVARSGGIRSGAQALRTPRSTVSRRLAELERAVGAPLVVRSTRRFALTELGTELFGKSAQLEELLRSTADVTDRAVREPTGTLTVAASPMVGEEFLPEVVETYLRRFPRVRLTLELANSFVDLTRGTVDLAIRTGPLAERTDLYATRLGASVKGVFASPSYVEEHGAPLDPRSLAEHECIAVAEGSRASVWALKERGTDVHVTVSGRLRVNSYRLALKAAAAGLGIARLPTLVAAPLVKSGALVPLLQKHWDKNDLFAVHTAGRQAPPKIRAFIELVRAVMKRQLAA